MAFSEVSVPVVTKYNDKGMQKAVKDLNRFGKTIDKVAVNALKAAANFAFLQGGRALFDFGAGSVQQARDLQRNLNGLEAVFGELAPRMEEFTERASELGLSQNEAAQATTFLGSVLKQSGFDLQNTTELTQQLVALGTDLAIVYGYDVSEALLGMTALFRGEYDPIEKFGVAMKQSEIDAEKAAIGLGHLTGANERYADQLIRVKFLMDRASDSQGQFQEQGNTLFAQQRILNAEFENMKARIGEDLLPIFANLASLIRSEVLPVIGPALQEVFLRFITLIRNLIENKDELIPKITAVIDAVGFLITAFVNITNFIANNIRFIVTLGSALISFYAISKGIAGAATLWKAYTIAVNTATGATKRFNIVSRRSIAGVVAALAAGAIGNTIFNAMDEDIQSATESFGEIEAASSEALSDLEELGRAGLDAFTSESIDKELENLRNGIGLVETGLGDVEDAANGAAGAIEGVSNFYQKLSDEAQKQSARVQLEAMGATSGLIDAILGSGDQWRAVFADVVSRGIDSVRDVQALFAQTKAGFDEAMAEYEEEVLRPFEQFRDGALQARDAMLDFLDSVEILPTIEREMGKFERSVADDLKRIEEDLAEAFDNEQLLESSYRNLQQYARQELGVLQQIERQRDDILRRRDAAAALIDSVNESVLSAGKLVDVLRNVQNETDQVDMTRIVKDTIAEANGLREFEVIVTSAVVDPIKEVVSRSDQLVRGYRNIVERTKTFVNNMKALRELGLDPTLFNQLVEAGVDAGGATAEALLEGGADTVNEVNSLFGQLNSLGAELGQETAQVMYGQGERFVDGIVNGLEAQASQLEEQAIALAGAFTSSFEALLISGIEIAIAKAEVALSKMPTLEDMPSVTSQRDTTTTVTTRDGEEIPAFATPATVQAMVDKRRQEVEDMRRAAQIAAEAARAAAERSRQQREAEARRAAQQEKVSRQRASSPGNFPVYENVVINTSNRADGASVAKTISDFTYKNTTRVSDSWQQRTLRAF